MRMESSHSQIVSLIWNIADDVLRDVFLRGQPGLVKIGMTTREDMDTHNVWYL